MIPINSFDPLTLLLLAAVNPAVILVALLIRTARSATSGVMDSCSKDRRKARATSFIPAGEPTITSIQVSSLIARSCAPRSSSLAASRPFRKSIRMFES